MQVELERGRKYLVHVRHIYDTQTFSEVNKIINYKNSNNNKKEY